ncbi:MAG: phosphotransferase [Microbacteriaceae bacterium]|nr:phosphotransferase [Microbacteriaceae bacterium]
MNNSPLTLAALATCAVPNLHIVGARPHSFNEDGNFAAIVAGSDRGEIIVRVPNSEKAMLQQSAEMQGQRALNAGARSQLPFLVPEVLGTVNVHENRVAVSTFVPGARFNLEDLTEDSLLVASLAGVFESLHQLPATILNNSGLPVRSAEDCRVEALRLVDKARETQLLPATVYQRWLDILQEKTLWNFLPTVIHGSIAVELLRVVNDSVSGLLGWEDLSVGDPAVDFAWLCPAPIGVLRAVVGRYSERTDSSLENLIARAFFYHELELAKWLLHGVETHDQQIIDDAVLLLDGLVDNVQQPLPALEQPELNVANVSALLSSTSGLQQQLDTRNDTAVLAALDDERIFSPDNDFSGEKLPADSAETSPKTGQESAAQTAATEIVETAAVETNSAKNH